MGQWAIPAPTSSRPDRSTKQSVALPLEARIVLCPIRSIRVIRSLMTRTVHRAGVYRSESISKMKAFLPFGSTRRVHVVLSSEPSSKENNLTNATNGAVGGTRCYSQSSPDRSPKQSVALPVEARIVHCPIRSIRVIRSLMHGTVHREGVCREV